jgi:UDP-2,3-diacylglucosamine pyrophosphatase LpxH
MWISDLHLGSRRARAAALLDFLRRHEAENLFLVGDIIDHHADCGGWGWSAVQGAVIDELRTWLRRGTRIELIAGNHDFDPAPALRLLGLRETASEMVYRTAEGRNMLVMHGHQFDQTFASDQRSRHGRRRGATVELDRWRSPDGHDQLRRSLARRVYGRLWGAMRPALDERAIYAAVRAWHADGIICGHTHRAEQRLIGPLWYINDGDWVESCTALVEGLDGALRLIRWRPSAEVEAGLAQAAI